MTSQRVAVLLMLTVTAACGGPKYYADGPRGSFDVSGEYAVDEFPSSNNCLARNPRPQKTAVIVEHSPNAGQVVLTRNRESYAGTIQSDGRFKTEPALMTQGTSEPQMWLEGRFNTTGFEATVHVRALDDIVPTVPGRRSTGRACEYRLRWNATKVN